jgi:cation diffusion facilitator CzcD-associated flavoprotein CzcO
MIPGINTFSGDRLIHSSAFTSAADCSGKAVVVVGAGTSAHDIASEYALKGAKVTMIQRSSTMVASQKVVALLTGRLYNESSVGLGWRSIRLSVV